MEVTGVTSSTIELKGISFSDGAKLEKIMDVCHKYKHLFKDGYPCGRRTRKKISQPLKKWGDCPEICFTYYLTNDNKDHHLAIQILVSDEESLLKKYTKREIEYFTQLYTQFVSDSIMDI